MAAPRFLIEDYAGVTVVTLTDSTILDAVVIDNLARDLYVLTDQRNKQKLVLDFCNVKTLSSRALGMIINLQKKARDIKGTVVLCGVKPEIKKIFSITGLEKEFKFYADDAAALDSFGVRVS